MAGHQEIHGYTLLELLVVLGIIGSVSSVVLPRYSATVATWQQSREVGTVVDLINIARLSSISNQTVETVSIDLKHNEFSSTATSKVLKLDIAWNVTVTTVAGVENTQGIYKLNFYPSGSSSGAQLKIEKDTFTYVYSVNWTNSQVRPIKPREGKS